MSATYVLESQKEAQRLEKQSTSKNFSLKEEFKNVILPEKGKFLDAGCGSGVACKFINEILPQVEMYGCDLSNDRLDFAKLSAPKSQFFQADLSELSNSDKKYDCIINRYVAHHMNLEMYKKTLREFKNSLNPNGKLVIIDAEGALVNLGTTNSEILNFFENFKGQFPGNLFMARYIPSLLCEIGFKDVSYEIQVMDFQGEDRAIEIEQYKERFENSKSFYIQLLGSEEKYQVMRDLYLSELEKAPIFYNKFIIQASC